MKLIDGFEYWIRLKLHKIGLMSLLPDVSKGPKYITFMIGDRCNSDCLMCLQAPVRKRGTRKSWEEMPFSIIENTLLRYHTSLESLEIISYGEPMLHKKFLEILGLAKLFSLILNIITNGSMLLKYADQIAEQPGFITVSIDAPDEELYSQIRRGLDFTNVMNGLDLLVHSKQRHPNRKIGINMTVFSINRDKIFEMASLANRMGLDYLAILRGVFLEKTEARGMGIPLFDSSVRNQVEEAKKAYPNLNIINYFEVVSQIMMLLPGTNICQRPWLGFEIDPVGRSHPCCASYSFDLDDYSIDLGYFSDEIWLGEPMNTLRKQMITDKIDPIRFGPCIKCISEYRNFRKGKGLYEDLSKNV